MRLSFAGFCLPTSTRPAGTSRLVGVIVALMAWAALAAPAIAAPLVGAGSNRCLDVSGNVDTLGQGLQIWDCNGQANQNFELTAAGELRTFNGTRCVDAFNNQTANGTRVVIWSCNGGANQQWRRNADGSIAGLQSGRCIDVNAAGTANGTIAILWSCNGQANQRWNVTGTTDPTALVVDIGTVIRPVSRVGSGTLYGLSNETTPSVSIMQPLKLTVLRQPPPLHQHRPNGVPAPIGDTLWIMANARTLGAKITVDMADSFDGFPYLWTNWNDWLGRIDRMIAAARARSEYTATIYAWEPWNEPDWTWPTAAAGSFNDGWVRTFRQIRLSEPGLPIMGPSDSNWNLTRMRSFLTNARNTNTLPDVTSWHELSGWQIVPGNVRAYRALERELGIAARPISINEYATPSEIDVPSSVNHYIAHFEREGVRDAQRAFWFEAGTLNGLLHNGQPTASYWMYKWYADQTGNIVRVTPTTNNDGVAAYDSGRRLVSLVFGGQAGNTTIRVNGIGSFGPNVVATLDRVNGTGRTTNVSGPTRVTSATYPVINGTATIPISGQNGQAAYLLTVTPQ
jgi:hypothetical protein